MNVGGLGKESLQGKAMAGLFPQEEGVELS